jgi:hypothetical protein
VAKNVLSSDKITQTQFQHRGIQTVFDHKHFDLSVIKSQTQTLLSRDKVCQSTDDSTISAITGDPLPLHGIHYWEFKLKSENPSHLKKVYIGLCSL